MKKGLFLCAGYSLLLLASVCGQPAKGDWRIGIGGSMNFDTPDFYTTPLNFGHPEQFMEVHKEKINRQRNFRVTAQSSYSLSNLWQIGCMLGYGEKRHDVTWSKYVPETISAGYIVRAHLVNEAYKQKTWIVQPYARYFLAVNKILSLALKGGIDLSTGKSDILRLEGLATNFHYENLSEEPFNWDDLDWDYPNWTNLLGKIKIFGASVNLTPEIWIHITPQLAATVSIFEGGYYHWRWNKSFVRRDGSYTDSISEFKLLYAQFGVGFSYRF